MPRLKRPVSEVGPQAETVLLDARGLSCPLPLLEARRALQLSPPGTVLVVLATDPAAPADFADFALARDLELEEARDADGSFRLTLRAMAR